MSEITTQPFILPLHDRLGFYLRTYYEGLLRLPRGPIVAALILAAPALLLYKDLLRGQSVIDALAWLAFLLSLWLVLLPGLGVFRVWSTGRTVEPQPSTLTLAEDYAAYDSPEIHGKIAWANVSRVLVYRRHIAIFVQAGVAWLAPKDAFATPEDAAAFAAFAIQKQKAARHKHVQAFSAAITPAAIPPDGTAPDSLTSPPFTLRFHHFLLIYLIGYYVSCRRVTTVLILAGAVLGMPWWLYHHLASAGSWPEFWQLSAVTAAAIAGAIFVVMPPILATAGWFSIRNRKASIVSRHVTISSDSLASDGQTFDGGMAWKRVRHISRPFGLMLFWTGPCTALPLADKAFASKADADAFYQTAREYWRAAAKSTLDGKA